MRVLYRAVLTLALLSLFRAAFSAESGSQIYGTYQAGCLTGSVELPLDSPDYQVQIWGEGRNFAHPSMLSYLKGLIERSKEAGLPPLLIGDLSFRYGGPYGPKSSHASHSIGLDVDLPLEFASPRLTARELRHPQSHNIVTSKGPNARFTGEIATYIRLAADDPRVERIFVNPRIKEHLCKLYAGQDRSWLRVVRPWFAHRAHMHVRLACPPDSPYCVPQSPVPQGDGCGYEVASWLLPPAKPAPGKKPVAAKKAKPMLPAQCEALLKLNSR